MSRERLLEPAEAEPLPASRDDQVSPGAEQIGRWPLSEPFPTLLRDQDLMRVLGIGKSRFYLLKKAGRFDRFIVKPDLTKSTRYSGTLIRAYVRGELSDVRFFGGARRHALKVAGQ